ncbi:hypothetical protein BV898_15880 [Hypsibius exemplaris]|uniref:Receptor ligand binding region domain-containing protein n=1 Tax=Hypsibius exemplaris TaxID=2072580 RepID=A0A9X6RL63_HYPEX|nr:hypothetical protein BV898_15880 [Hypsibius exemplaris]
MDRDAEQDSGPMTIRNWFIRQLDMAGHESADAGVCARRWAFWPSRFQTSSWNGAEVRAHRQQQEPAHCSRFELIVSLPSIPTLDGRFAMAQSAARISEYYFKNASISTPGTCYALITSPCNDDTGISSLAKEFDWPSFDILPLSDEVPPSPTRSLPANEIAIFGAIWGYSQILLEILQDFGCFDNLGTSGECYFVFLEFPVFRSLLMLTYYPTGQELMQLNEEIETRAQTAYHSVYPKNTKPLDNVPVRAAYDIVELLAAVLYTSRSVENSSRVTAEGTSTENPCSGLKFAKATTNRSFALSTEPAFVDSNRIRNIDLDIFAFNTTLRSMTSVGSYDWTKHAIIWNKNYSIDWPTVGGTPPLDVPACGYSGLEGLCAAAALRQTITAVASSVSALLVLGITWAGWKFFTKKLEWFLLEARDLTTI